MRTASDARIDRIRYARLTQYAEDDREEFLRDVLTDLRHWADLYAVDFEEADDMAAIHYREEVAGH